MAPAQKQTPVQDPDNIAETFVNGPINCNVIGQFAQLTFTYIRPDISDLFAGRSEASIAAVVKARLIMPIDELTELRNLLNQMIRDAAPGSASSH